MLVYYDNEINKIEMFNLKGLLVSYLGKEFLEYENDLCELFIKYVNMCQKIGVDKYEDIMDSHYKNLDNPIYNELISIGVSKDKARILSGTIFRLGDWFLHTDEELSKISKIPLVIDNNIKIFRDYSNKFDLNIQRQVNRQNIIDFINSAQIPMESYDRVNSHFDDMIAFAEKKLMFELQPMREHLTRVFKRNIFNCVKPLVAKPINNRSASFFTTNKDSLLETIFSYNSSTGMNDILYTVYSTFTLDSNYDFVKSNLIKNKGMGLRFVYNSNPYINAGMNAIYVECVPFLKELDTYGAYDQEYNITRMIDAFSKELNDLDSNAVALSLDVSKYSDCLPISLINKVLGCFITDYTVLSTVQNCLNFPVLYKGKTYNHNVSSQGIPLDFMVISLANLFVQYCIEYITDSKILFTNVTGDDAVTILENKLGNNKEIDYYVNLGRAVYASLGMKVNTHKALACDCKSGTLSYLKYRSLVDNRKLINVSGISPWLLFKEVVSFHKIIDIQLYFNKVHIDYDRESMIKIFYNYFHEDIIGYTETFLRIPRSNINLNNIDILDRMLYLSKEFGGSRSLEEYSVDEVDELINKVISLKSMYRSIFVHQDSMTEDYEAVCNDLGIDINSTYLGSEMVKYAISDAKYCQESFYNLINTLNEDNNAVDLLQVVRELKSIIRSFQGKMFQKYISGDITTNRRTNYKFQDSFLIFDDISKTKFIPFAEMIFSTDIKEKGYYDLAHKIIAEKCGTLITKEVRSGGLYSNNRDEITNGSVVFKRSGSMYRYYEGIYHTSLTDLDSIIKNNFDELINEIITSYPNDRYSITRLLENKESCKDKLSYIIRSYMNDVKELCSRINDVNLEVKESIKEYLGELIPKDFGIEYHEFLSDNISELIGENIDLSKGVIGVAIDNKIDSLNDPAN